MTEANGKEVAKVSPPRLPYDTRIEERFGIDIGGWRALTDAIFPSASTTDAIILALSYCKVRKLDPFKKPVQIVPMWDGKRKQMVDTVWPGIGELRTTAFRTGQYAGRDAAIFGDMREFKLSDEVTITYPEWCEVVVYRVSGGVRCAFHGPRVHWMETYATAGKDTNAPNKMWGKRPNGQLEKCAEAAALRAAFPEELGNEYAAEEMEGKVIDHEAMGSPETVGVPKSINSSQAKKNGLWEEFKADMAEAEAASPTIDEMTDWWNRADISQRVLNLPKQWQDPAHNEYELSLERIAARVKAVLDQERAAQANA